MESNPLDFLFKVWKSHAKPGDYVFMASKQLSTGKWRDHPILWDTDQVSNKIADIMFNHPPKEYCLYFCPLTFSGKLRQRDTVKNTKFLWQDLDYANPKFIDEALKPSISWESSPGRFQGLWELDKVYEGMEVETLNRDLAYHLGADKGGWDLTQVLRIPGTHNNKYKEKPEVKLVTFNRKIIRKPTDMSAMIKKQTPVYDDNTAGMKDLSSDSLIKKHHKKIPRKALTMLLAKHATVGKRSDIIWYLQNELNNAGLNPHEIYSLIKNSVWNKYAGRHDEEERLTSEIKKVIEGSFEKGDKVQPKDNKRRLDNRNSIRNKRNTRTHSDVLSPEIKEVEEDEDEEESKFGLRLESYHDLMGNISTQPGWLVEGFWARRSHGIVAGEPKSFKSTFVMDLAMSVASGKPFLGQFPIMESGPVIYIQNENADWIMKDKIEKLIFNRDLSGQVKSMTERILKITFPPDVPIHFINQQGFLMNDPLHQQVVEKLCEEIKPVLIVFDPLYLMFDGDVNSAKELNPALTWLLHIKNEYKTGVMVIHHYNKGGTSSRGGQRMLGSTTLHGWIESAWYLAHPESKDGTVSDGEVAKVSGEPVSMILDREFRGAGHFPKIELALTMGETGDTLYKIEIQKHVGRGHPSEVDEVAIEMDIVNLLEMKRRPITQRQLSDDTGVSRRVIKKILDSLAEQGKVNITKDGVKLIRETG